MHVESPTLPSIPMPSGGGQNGFSETSGAVTSLTQLLSVSKTVLLQAIDVLDNYLTSDDQLTTHSKFLPGSTIGIAILFIKNIPDN